MRIEASILSGTIMVPSSKSIGHRLLICAGLATGWSKVYGLNMSKDISATMEALRALGAKIDWITSELTSEEPYWAIEGIGCAGHRSLSVADDGESGRDSIEDAVTRIRCGESGSTLRFMIPVAMSIVVRAVFDGEGRLIERPVDDYFPIFEQNDIKVTYAGRLPMTLNGQLKGGAYSLSGKVSSQYTTGLLLAAPMLADAMSLNIIDEMESKGYIDLTIDIMRQFGVQVSREGYRQFLVSSTQSYQSAEVRVEGDYSQAAFWIVAGLIGKEKIGLKGLRADSLQGDREVLEIVERMGGQFEWVDEMLWVTPSRTNGTVIDAAQCPDLVPVLCVLGALSQGETRVINGQRLRVKESDRILATVTELKKLGALIEETEDGMVIQGQDSLIGGCTVDSWNDHRIVMAMAVAATRCMHGININGHEAVAKSYPHFFEDYRKLGEQV